MRENVVRSKLTAAFVDDEEGNTMKRGFGIIPATVCFLAAVAGPSNAQAGMTVYGLRDIYRVRLEDISFFIFLFVACSFILKLLWNHAVKGFPSIPRLTLVRAFSVAGLLGLSMLLILTMISGIREVLTPEAWRRQGSSYRLNAAAQEPARRRSLEQLRAALFDYARSHDGKFPAHDYVPEIADKLWETPDQLGSHYLYSGGLTTNFPNAVLAVEPANFGQQRLGLKVSGEIGFLPRADIESRMVGLASP
jgi:hypothetical protein